ncbi:MAG: hypothetical protein P8184_12055 [Calditrichia bacterium]
MKIYDNKGMLIIPELDKVKKLGRRVGITTAKNKVLLRQVFCPEGHPLISDENPKFDGKPGIHLICEGDYIRQSVYLSPFQGDNQKIFNKDFEQGEIIKVFCPVCQVEFPKLAPHDCKTDAMYIALFLDNKASFSNAACICNIWGCYASQLRLSGEVLAEVHMMTVIR